MQHISNPEAAIRYARRWVQLDPLYEPAQVRLMQLLAQGGQINAARRQYRHFAQLLAEDLGATPTRRRLNLFGNFCNVLAGLPTALRMQESSPPDGAITTLTRSPRFLTEHPRLTPMSHPSA